MRGVLTITLVLSHMLLLTDYILSHPVCLNMRSPFAPKTPLVFCQYSGSVCCNSAEDKHLRNQFEAMNVSDDGCASLLKSILCARCDQFSAELYRLESAPRKFPVLCNASVSANSTQVTKVDFCSKVWDECKNVSILNSPFPLHGGMPLNGTSKLADLWQSKSAFCNEFSGASDAGEFCFDGGPVVRSHRENLSPPEGICLEKMGHGSYLNMVAHPDGSNRVFVSDQPGKIWLATVPGEGSGELLALDELDPFLDLSDRVYHDGDLGMMGIAFHPNFQRNGRFFVSFNCDKMKWPECSGRCSCNLDVGCDPSTLDHGKGGHPCQYSSVISEFTANGTTLQPSSVKSVRPKEVRRIFTMGLPFANHHAGQILFGPQDGYLYFMMGDGGSSGDPYNFAQNKRSLLGKIMRLDVDNMPNATAIPDLDRWGNYSVPSDNPFAKDKELRPEIWALGFRNPWRCSFDSERPSYFLCADVGQEQYEEVDVVTKGGNYGWRVYEGLLEYNPPNSPGGNTTATSINPIFPVMGYNHSQVNSSAGTASITGGYFYRSKTDPCMYGRYLYADLYGGGFWAGAETPKDSGNFSSSQIPIGCAQDSPIQCSAEARHRIFSFGEDNRKDVFILASSGVYRVVRPSRCGYNCSKENSTALTRPYPASPSPSPSPSPNSAGRRLCNPLTESMPLILSLLLLAFCS